MKTLNHLIDDTDQREGDRNESLCVGAQLTAPRLRPLHLVHIPFPSAPPLVSIPLHHSLWSGAASSSAVDNFWALTNSG